MLLKFLQNLIVPLKDIEDFSTMLQTLNSWSRSSTTINRLYSCLMLSKGAFSRDAHDHENLKRMKLMKRLGSTFLFGSTLIVAIVLRKKRQSQVSEQFKDANLLSKNPHYHKNITLYNYKGYILPSFVVKEMVALQEFKCRADDIYVVSFPKTGTTWLQEIIFAIATDLDFNAATEENIETRFPYLEFIYPGVSAVEKMPSPRFIKTHLPYSLLPPDVLQKKPKIFCIMRNPKDVTVSYYHFVRMMTMTNYTGNFKDFFKDMIADKVPYGPLWKHYADIWSNKDEENILLVFYEDFQKDIHANIQKIAQFLGKSLTDEEVEKISDHCSFTNMSQNPSVNYQHWDDFGIRKTSEAKFLRKGKVGDWRNYFTADMNSDMDKWIKEHFEIIEPHFKYELFEAQETI